MRQGILRRIIGNGEDVDTRMLSRFLEGHAARTHFDLNDFSQEFDRGRFDRCSTQYIVIRKDGRYNIAVYSRDILGRNRVSIPSVKWFTRISHRSFLAGSGVRWRNGHWGDLVKDDRDANPPLVLVGDGAKSNFMDPRTGELASGTWFEYVLGDWTRSSDGPRVRVEAGGEELWFAPFAPDKDRIFTSVRI